MSTSAVRIRELERVYPEFRLGPISPELEPGSFTALIGPNGAGKTTLLRSIFGTSRPDAGSVESSGRMAFVGGASGYFQRETVECNLAFIAGCTSQWSNAVAVETAARLELPLSRRVDRLSKGGLTRLALISALGQQPALLLLDEPMEGLDPLARETALDAIQDFQQTNETAVIYCTHVLSDVARVSDQLAFLKQGRLVERASPVDLADSWRRICFRWPDAPEQQVVSGDYQQALDELRGRGAETLDVTPMSIEEIALQILGEGETYVANRNG